MNRDRDIIAATIAERTPPPRAKFMQFTRCLVTADDANRGRLVTLDERADGFVVAPDGGEWRGQEDGAVYWFVRAIDRTTLTCARSAGGTIERRYACYAESELEPAVRH